MRDIKFRAWDKKTLKMRLFDLYELAKWGACAILFNETSTFSQYDLCPKLNEDLEIMQFTGLLDKNLKPIYEGDVVQISYWLNGEVERTRRDVIGFGYGKFDFKTPNYRETLRGSDIEIVGNIHENPELLTNP
jgi:uncharacterized phage protein (TIGR01671 family)